MKISNYFVLANEKVKANAIRAVQSLPANGDYEIRIAKKDKNRSNRQNRFYWGPWLETFSNWAGSTKDELHKQFKVRFIGVEKSMVSGVLLVEPKSSADLTVEEFTEFLQKVEMVATEMGITLPARDYHGMETR